MLQKFEQVTRSQKARILMLFIALAIVAAVVVIAYDGYEEYQGAPAFSPAAFDDFGGYDDYLGGPVFDPDPGITYEPPPVNWDVDDGYSQYAPGGSDLQNGYILDPGDAAGPNLSGAGDGYDAYDGSGQVVPPAIDPTPAPAPSEGYEEFGTTGGNEGIMPLSPFPVEFHCALTGLVDVWMHNGMGDPVFWSFGLIGGSFVMPTLPAQPGFGFLGWRYSTYDSPPNPPTGLPLDDAAVMNFPVNDPGIIFHAEWAPYFNVTFNLNGGTYSGAPLATQVVLTWPEGVRAGSEIGYMNVPSRSVSGVTLTNAGHTFTGWHTSPAAAASGAPGESAQVIGFTVVSNAALTFYAGWSPITHTVTFNLSGGSYTGPVSTLNQEIVHGQNAVPINELNLVGPVAGHVLDGWVRTSSIDPPGGTPISPSALDLTNIVRSTTFTAIWVFVDVDVVFNYNFPGGAVTTITRRHALNIGMSNVPVPTRPGYTFIGWGPFDGPMPGHVVPPGVAPNLVGAGANAGTREYVGSIILDMNAPPLVFYAQWRANVYTVTFILGDGALFGTYNGSMANEVRTFAFNQCITDNMPMPGVAPAGLQPPAGYYFDNWTRIADNFWLDMVTPSALAVTTNWYFIARWVPEGQPPQPPAQVTFILNGGLFTGSLAGAVPSPAGTLEVHFPAGPIPLASIPMTINGLSRTGYTFLGWICDDTGADMGMGPNTLTSTSVSGGALYARSFTASWIRTTHTIRFVLNGGTYAGDVNAIHVDRIVECGDTIWSPNTSPAQGYFVPLPPAGMEFAGWQRDGLGPQLTGAALTARWAGYAVTGPALYVASWRPLHDTPTSIRFILNGGIYNNSPNDVVHTRLVGNPIGLNYVPTPIRENYTFSHWEVTSGSALLPIGLTRSALEVSWIVVEPWLEFTARWTPLPGHQVTFLLNSFSPGDHITDGAGNIIANSIVINDVAHNALLGPAVPNSPGDFYRHNYVFEGWRLNDAGTLLPSAVVAADPITNSRIYLAIWRRITHEVVFVLNNGTYVGSSAPFSVWVPQSTQVERVPAPIREDWRLTGWELLGTNIVLTSSQIADSYVLNALTLELADNEINAPTSLTFTAQWTRIYHSVTFVLNGGNIGGNQNNIAFTTVFQGTLIGDPINSVTVPAPVNPPASFTGWLLDGTSNVYDTAADVEAIMVSATPGALRFIAQWDTPSHLVTFELGGGNVGGNTANITANIGHGLEIGSNVPEVERNLYILHGWQEIVGGVPSGPLMNPLALAALEVTGPATFRAIWVQLPIHVTFLLNGGLVNGSANPISTLVPAGDPVGEARVPTVPVRGNDEFAGWLLVGTTQVLSPAAVALHEVTTLTIFEAQWDVEVHTVTFVLNGGNVGGSLANIPVDIIHGGLIGGLVPLPVRTNYTFLGWRENGETITSSQVAGEVVVSDRTFTAHWSRNTHSVTFVLSGGNVGGNTADITRTVDEGNVVGTAPAAVRPGSTLTGWQQAGTSIVLNPAQVAGHVVDGPLVFIALWDTATYPVTFDLNDGIYNAATTPVIRNIIGGAVVGSAAIPVPTRLNYELQGWRLQGTTTVLTMSQVANMVVTGPMTFVAAWEYVAHPVVFNLNGGNLVGNTANVSFLVAQGTAMGAGNIPNNPAIDGMAFTGWREVGTNRIWTALEKAAHVVTGPMTFIAQWDGLSHPVVFDLNGGNIAGNTANIEVLIMAGAHVGFVPGPMRAGYELLGWRMGTAVENMTQMAVAGTVVNAPLRFTAVWGTVAAVTHPVIFELNGGNINGNTAPVVRNVPHNAIISVAYLVFPVRETGATLLGWREVGTTVTLTPAQVSNIIVLAPRTFIAVWDDDGTDIGDNATITFILNGGTVAGSAANVVRQVPLNQAIGANNVPAPIRGYFEFSGWRESGTTNAPLTGLQVAGLVVTGSRTFEAVWTPVSRNVILHRNPYSASIPGHATAVYVYVVQVNGDVTFTITPPGNGAIFTTASTATPPVGYTIVSGPTILANGNMLVTIGRCELTDPTIFTLTFNPGIGRLPTGESGVRQGPFGTRVDIFPTPINPTNQAFLGWFYGSTLVTPPLVLTRDITLVAHFTPIGATPTPGPSHCPNQPTPTPGPSNQPTPGPSQCPNQPTPQPATYFVVAFNPAPGNHAQGSETGIRWGRLNTVITNIPANPVRPNYTFGGWRFPNGTMLTGNQLTVTGNKTLTAVWTRVGAPTPTPAPPATPRPSATPAPSTCPSTPPSHKPPERPNPQTSAATLGLSIFGTVMIAGIAIFTIASIAKKQYSEANMVRSDKARDNLDNWLVEQIKGKPRK